ncbi:FAS1-like dehydratase domain-containing protein [Mameliella sediminis]|uniref:FAS1-like dehydratase domain-containing protein n=1 Tax=Mameliella sediminis TaxID=2836866 RepID=UPI001C4849D9|nr:MaoC family dehydratase N-terminal domain-containing protein [Mameliella sediminis]MBV7394100.1 MaoC family dehydratase N-terminal domain-containing protein [Mameliella sediminis]MBY6162474.1 MaoC family dehydratase N-terminal domain-containing protein [Mameliella alba]MBY6170948.1 MaoC family dehydratase N-terminal domain-containing protein [Mameliella alba]MBY6175961.1 MaoC family dehydratase N-terminal domain-containing protein [Mameliella alba]
MTQHVREWIGRSEVWHDTLRAQPACFMQATIGREPDLKDGDALPPLWHWLYFLEAKPAGVLGRDGHPQKGGFLPPVELPRRMWAGGRFEFHEPLRLGDDVRKVSTIKDVVEKDGRSGKLCFVTVRHEMFSGGQLAVTEEHDIVYREDPAPDAPRPVPAKAPENAEFSEEIHPTQVMLFRYSALTFNGHRIHYDVDYARQVEGYDGLVFHGPLTATLLVDLASRKMGRTPRAFSFRGLSPLSGLTPFRVEGRSAENAMDLWATRNDGALAMSAKAEF